MTLHSKAFSFIAATSEGLQSIGSLGLGASFAASEKKVLLLWTTGLFDFGINTSIFAGFGISVAPGDHSAVATASFNGQSTTVARRRVTNKAIAVYRSADMSATNFGDEADLASWDSDGFTLDWTNIASAGSSERIIHGLLLWGDSITDAAVVNWQAATSTGNQSIGSLSFQPTLLIDVHGGGHAGSPPSNSVGASLGVGVANASLDQWCWSFFSQDGQATSNTQRNQRTGQFISAPGGGQAQARLAELTSLDSNGWTVNWSAASGAAQHITLALAGDFDSQIGAITKSVAGAPVTQTINTPAFTPVAALLASDQHTASTSVEAHSRFGMGFSDGAVHQAALGADQNGVGTTSVWRGAWDDRAFVKGDNNSSTIDASATVSLQSQAVDLEWTVNDAVATQVLFLALGTEPLPFQIARPTATLVPGDWRTHADGTDLHTAINDEEPDFDTWIQSGESPESEDECKVRVDVLTDPDDPTRHYVRAEIGKDEADGDRIDVTLRLFDSDGTTLLAEETFADVAAGFTPVEIELTEGEAGSISDYAGGVVVGFAAVSP